MASLRSSLSKSLRRRDFVFDQPVTASLIRSTKERSREQEGTFILTFKDMLVVDGLLIRERDESDCEPQPG